MDELNEAYHQLWRKSGWTRARVSKELGVNYSSVYRWETGQTKPEPSKLLLLAQLIGEPVSINGVMSGPSVGGPARIDDAETALLSDLRKLPQPVRGEVIAAMAKMLRACQSAHDETRETARSEALRLNALQMDADAMRLLAHRRGSPATAPADAPVAPAPANRPRKIRSIR